MPALAETLEHLERQINSFDWERAESEFDSYQAASEDVLLEDYMLSPKEETFGRSSSGARALGGVAMRAVGVDRVTAMRTSPEARRVKREFYTSAEEGFATDEEFGDGLEDRSFSTVEVIGEKVMAPDGKTAVSDLTAAGLVCARVRAETDEHFGPQLVRTEWDDIIAQTGNAMARGETDFNTYMMVSPYPEEEEKVTGPEYWREIGYAPRVKRGFVWLFYAGKNGFVTGSLSFSGSDRERIREVLAGIGIDIPADEVTHNYPGYAFTGNLTEEAAKALATNVADEAGDPAYRKPNKHTGNKITNTVDVTKQYEPIMERVFNESYVHICESLVRGYQTAEARDLIYQLADKAPDFKQHYASALYRMRADGSQFTHKDWQIMHELLVYSTIEMMRALHLKKSHLDDVAAFGSDGAYALPTYLQAAESALFQDMLSSFGAEGARNNRVYSACGLSISLGDGGPDGPESFNPFSTVYGYDKLGSRTFACPKGCGNFREIPGWKEGTCWFCGTDVSCEDKKPARAKQKAAPTWESVFGIKPKSIKKGVGKRALAGAHS